MISTSDSLLELLAKGRNMPIPQVAEPQPVPEQKQGFSGTVQKTTFGEGFKVKCCTVGCKSIAIGGEDGIIEIWD